jgi:hypothetical protein
MSAHQLGAPFPCTNFVEEPLSSEHDRSKWSTFSLAFTPMDLVPVRLGPLFVLPGLPGIQERL